MVQYGKEFSLKNQNCYDLVREFYPELPAISYRKLSPSSFLEIAQNNGWYIVKYKDAVKGDVFISEEPTHLMVYLGNNKIAHHPLGRLSRREPITEKLFNSIKYTVRRN